MKNLTKHIILLLLLIAYSASAISSFSGDRLEEAVISYIESNSDSEVRVLLLNEIKNFKFNDENITAKIKHNEELRGYTHIYILFSDDIKIVKEIKIPVRVRVFDKVMTYGRALKSGEKINMHDLSYSNKEITDFSKSELPDKDNVIGKVLKKSVSAGSIIVKNDISDDVIISRGDKITVVVRSGAVQIRTTGTALNDAKTGEQVRVKRDGLRNMILYGKASENGSVYISSNEDNTR